MDKVRKAEHNKQARESVETLKDCAKDDFFGIWEDKQQNVHVHVHVYVYVRDMRQGRGIE